MRSFSQFVPEHIRRLAQSRPRTLEASDRANRQIRLNLNENPFGPSPLALAAIQAALADLHRYPEADPTWLERDIANFHTVAPEEVIVTAGATELLGIMARALLAPGRNAITSARSFLVYRLATEASGGKLIEVETREHGYDLEAITQALDENTRMIFIANPNNPTGSLVPAPALTAFLDDLPHHVLLVIDEAYFDYADYFAQKRGVEFSHSLDYVRQKPNVIVLRTFSKAHGLAGLRVGYGIGPELLISLLKPLRDLFSVSSLALIAASAALFDRKHIVRAVENNAEQAEVLATGMRQLGLEVPPTWANFLYCELGQDAALFADRLGHQGVVVQPLGASGAATAIRVSIGTEDENARFLEVLAATGIQNS